MDEDEPLFLSLISDLFPGIQLDVAIYADLQKAISGQVASTKLINHPSWNLKVIQVGLHAALELDYLEHMYRVLYF